MNKKTTTKRSCVNALMAVLLVALSFNWAQAKDNGLAKRGVETNSSNLCLNYSSKASITQDKADEIEEQTQRILTNVFELLKVPNATKYKWYQFNPDNYFIDELKIRQDLVRFTDSLNKIGKPYLITEHLMEAMKQLDSLPPEAFLTASYFLMVNNHFDEAVVIHELMAHRSWYASIKMEEAGILFWYSENKMVQNLENIALSVDRLKGLEMQLYEYIENNDYAFFSRLNDPMHYVSYLTDYHKLWLDKTDAELSKNIRDNLSSYLTTNEISATDAHLNSASVEVADNSLVGEWYTLREIPYRYEAVTQKVYDQRKYDGRGNVIWEARISADTDLPIEIATTAYDKLGRQISYERDNNADGKVNYIETRTYYSDRSNSEYTVEYDNDGDGQVDESFKIDPTRGDEPTEAELLRAEAAKQWIEEMNNPQNTTDDSEELKYILALQAKTKASILAEYERLESEYDDGYDAVEVMEEVSEIETATETVVEEAIETSYEDVQEEVIETSYEVAESAYEEAIETSL
jgi:hypothetical protein